MSGRIIAIILLVLGSAAVVNAQPSAVPTITATGGWAGFVDDGRIDHGVVGGGLEWQLNRHLTVGPDVLWMVGPGGDRDLFVLGVARAGLRPLDAEVVPYVIGGAGLMQHRDEFYGGGSYTSTEGAFIGGGGVRLNVSRRVYIAPEFTIGWEPHMRASVTVGIRLQ